MKVKIKSFGPEIIKLIGREKIISLDSGSTIEDLIQRLEEEIKEKHGLTQNILNSFIVLLENGGNVRTMGDKTLRDGEHITILSPIRGG